MPRKKRHITENGRPPIFSDPKVLEAKIQEYWRTITRDKPVMQHRYESLDMTIKQVKALPEEAQEELMELVPVLNRNGDPIVETIWLQPPMILNLQLYLGLSKAAWAEYGHRDGFVDIVACARQVAESYLVAETAVRSNQTNGLKFLLSAVYGYREVSGVQVETIGKLEDEID